MHIKNSPHRGEQVT